MIIDNVDALKSWLAKLLEPICDADPSALANYVVALVKKDKPEKELKALCADQLDVFLQQETASFVDKLFESLVTKNYIVKPPMKEPPKDEPKPVVQKPDEKEKDKEEEADHAEDGREIRRRRSPLRNRPDFNESRSRDDRRRGVERKRRDLDRHGKSNEPYRERHERRRGSSRGRSRSRSRSRSTSRSRSGSRGRGREHWSKFEQERKEQGAYNPTPTPTPMGNPPPPPPYMLSMNPPPHQFSSRGPVVPSSVTMAVPACQSDNTTESWTSFYLSQDKKKSVEASPSKKQRCRDYDEKGFCVSGDLCPFDHGNDPLIVDDVILPTMIPFPPPPPGMPLPRMPLPPMTEPPPNIRMPPPPHVHPPIPGIFPMPGAPLIAASVTDTPPSGNSSSSALAPPGVGPPAPAAAAPPPPPPTPPPPSSCSSSSLPVHAQYSLSEYSYDSEAYNPESPGLTSRPQYRQFIPRIQTQRPYLIGLTSGEGQGSRAANIVIKTEPSVTSNSTSESWFSSNAESGKRPLSTADGPHPKKPWMDKPNFSSQHKPNFPKKNHYVNTKLEVRKIPRDLNNITKLNEHFSKFGIIVNIQVMFGGDPEAALIQYTSNEEARAAISSTEAVLNNRFIRVYWHREASGGQQEPGQGSSTSLATQHTITHKQHNPGAYVLNKTFPKPRAELPAVTQGASDPKGTSPELPTAATSAGGSHLKGPYTRTVLKPSSKSLGKTAKALQAQEVLKKKQEAMKLQQGMRKKKQEILEMQIECQKVLIARLETNRTMKPEERASIIKTLNGLSEMISALQMEIVALQRPAGTPVANSSQAKNKTDAQKELLDAELDIHMKLGSGEDTATLKRKLVELHAEATRIGLIPATASARPTVTPPTRGHGVRGRGRGRGVGRGGGNNLVVDHRPRALIIQGITQQEKEELRPHFMKFGEVEDLRDQDATSVIMTFKTRSEAENAANQGAKYNGRFLEISWYTPKLSSVSSEPSEEDPKQEAKTEHVSSSLLAEDEEEEDDDDEDEDGESRSWRRWNK